MTKRPVDIIGVPLDLGAKALGVELGPDAIRAAGLVHAFNCNGIPCVDHGNVTLPGVRGRSGTAELRGFDAQAREIVRVGRITARLVGRSVKNGRIPLTLGGDHSVAIGSVSGAFAARPHMSILWIDAHPDATTPETSLSKNIHGMPLAIALGYGDKRLVRLGRTPLRVPPDRVAVFGAKDMDEPEARLLKKAGVRVITVREIVEKGIASALREALAIVGRKGLHHHVSFDIDVIDQCDAPSAAIASRGGLTYREIRYVMETIGELGLVDSLDVVELNAREDTHQRTAKLAVEMISAVLGGRYTDYEEYMESQLKERNADGRV